MKLVDDKREMLLERSLSIYLFHLERNVIA